MLNNTSFLLSDQLSGKDIPQHIADFLHSDIFPATSEITKHNYALYYSDKGLSLIKVSPSKKKISEIIFIDFLGGKNGYRRKQDLTIKQPLAKAVGIKSGVRPTIFDATAGLGSDGFFLACLGSQITLCERSPVIAILLRDAFERARIEPETTEIIKEKISLIEGDSASILEQLTERFSTVYLDPMYPHRTNSALNKQEMRVIRNIVGDDYDSDKLFEAAMQYAEKRVVVKRPKGAPYLAESKPSFEVRMKNSRFDVYLTNF